MEMEMDLTKLVQGKNLTENEQAVLEYLMVHLDTALSQGVRSIARDNYTSTSTIMRLAKKLGYSGLWICATTCASWRRNRGIFFMKK